MLNRDYPERSKCSFRISWFPASEDRQGQVRFSGYAFPDIRNQWSHVCGKFTIAAPLLKNFKHPEGFQILIIVHIVSGCRYYKI
jgi:hypothetical protein